MGNTEQKKQKLEEIKSLLSELEEGVLLNHSSLPKIWEGLRELESFLWSENSKIAREELKKLN